MRAKISQFWPLMMLTVLLGAGTSTQASAVTVLPAPEILPGQTQSTQFVQGFTDFFTGFSVTFGSSSSEGPSGTFSEGVLCAPFNNPFGTNFIGFGFGLFVTGTNGVNSISIPGYANFKTAVANCATGTCLPAATGASFPTSVARSSIATDNGNTVTFSWGSPLIGNSGLFLVYVDTPNFVDPMPPIQITGANGQVSTVSNFISPSPVPLPAALPLFATGLGAMGLFGWRKKRKAAAALATA